ncbi:MAG: hypothetical protein QOE89_3220 [Pseudonocardiales bacterium]|nr:hypothetical protein [Pseudonocardiales bacterium]
MSVLVPSYFHVGPLASAHVQGVLRAGFLLAAIVGAYSVSCDPELGALRPLPGYPKLGTTAAWTAGWVTGPDI